jgi:enoyl-CoA hydratase/carnithine racemase
VATVRSRPGRVWRLTLARPEARNAVSGEMLEELSRALGDAAADPEARVVVLDGEGPDFCAGADLEELEVATVSPAAVGYGRALEEVLSAVEQHSLPILTAIHGAALGAGCQLALAADIAVGATDATFGIPAARLGVVLDFENTQRLVLGVGPKRAAAILLTGRTLSGTEAAAWGLIAEAGSAERLAERVRDVAEEIAGWAPLSVRGAKRAIREVLTNLWVDRTIEGFRLTDVDMMAGQAFASEDLKEGLQAFRERRAPRFQGR